MKRSDVMPTLNRHRARLSREYGVCFLAVFGSVARDEATDASDVDLLVDFDRPTGLLGLFALQDHLADLLGCSVDLGTPSSLKPRIRSRVLAECIHVP